MMAIRHTYIKTSSKEFESHQWLLFKIICEADVQEGWWRCVGGSLNISLYIFKNNFILLKYLLFFLIP